MIKNMKKIFIGILLVPMIAFGADIFNVLDATTFNGNTWTSGTGTLTIAAGKTFTANNTLTLTGADASSVAFGAGGTATYTANKLSVFAATTSSELASVLSDESGTGTVCMTVSCSMTTPAIGAATGTSLVVSGAVSGANIFTGASSLTLTTGAIGLSKMTASASAPGAGGAKLELVCGTNAGTAKLVISAGTSATTVTVIDNIGGGVAGC